MVFVKIFLKNVIAMNNIFDLLLKKYNLVLNDLSIGYPLKSEDIKQLLHFLHILHYLSFTKCDDSNLIKIISYYE